jgi:hypothetical protein
VLRCRQRGHRETHACRHTYAVRGSKVDRQRRAALGRCWHAHLQTATRRVHQRCSHRPRPTRLATPWERGESKHRCLCIRVCMPVCDWVSECVCLSVGEWVSVCVCMCVCVSVPVCAPVCVRAHASASLCVYVVRTSQDILRQSHHGLIVAIGLVRFTRSELGVVRAVDPCQVHTHTHTHIHTYIHTYTHTRRRGISVRRHSCLCVYVSGCACVCMCTCVRVTRAGADLRSGTACRPQTRGPFHQSPAAVWPAAHTYPTYSRFHRVSARARVGANLPRRA